MTRPLRTCLHRAREQFSVFVGLMRVSVQRGLVRDKGWRWCIREAYRAVYMPSALSDDRIVEVTRVLANMPIVFLRRQSSGRTYDQTV